jgi:glycosyltransferase involved in cell wall biosynthesis
MRIIHLSTSDITGGAARAGYRLHQGLLQNNITSKILAQQKESNDASVIGPVSNPVRGLANFKRSFDHLPKLLYPRRKSTIFHFQWVPEMLKKKIKTQYPDVVHLQWICGGFLNISTLPRINKPIVWTLHDMWPFTGGCHYSGVCQGYKKSCGKCPQLGSNLEHDLSRWTWRRKAKAWQNLNLSLIAPSHWMKVLSQQSSLFRDRPTEVIPYGIDTDLFSPKDRKTVRSYLGLPRDKKLILFGAVNPLSDRRKGFHLLSLALQQFTKTSTCEETELIVFGASNPLNPPNFGLKSTYLGRLYDDISLALVYAACDLFVVPSVEDNLPNTIIEAMACGTPCAAYRIGGISDMVSHKKNGYLAEPFSVEDLAAGIQWIIEDDARRQELSTEARKKITADFNLEQVANRYITLYKKIIHQS